MKRYNQVRNESYEPRSEMVEERGGDWVWYEDVEELESKYAEMLEALKFIMDDSFSYLRRVAFEKALVAIAEAEGGSYE